MKTGWWAARWPGPDGRRAPPPAGAGAGGDRATYRRLLAWSFALFNSIRTLSYLPTLWALHESGQSDQHSLLTWLSWTGANATMAAWLYEQRDRRVDRVIVVTLCNAVMCLVTSATIVWYRCG